MYNVVVKKVHVRYLMSWWVFFCFNVGVTEFPYMYISDSAYISAHVSYSDVNLCLTSPLKFRYNLCWPLISMIDWNFSNLMYIICSILLNLCIVAYSRVSTIVCCFNLCITSSRRHLWRDIEVLMTMMMIMMQNFHNCWICFILISWAHVNHNKGNTMHCRFQVYPLCECI